MKLDYDCVRNILLTVEALNSGECLTDKNYAHFPLIKDYSAEKIIYTICRIYEAGYFPKHTITEIIGGVIFSIDALTWDGHQFLDCIRDKTIWAKTKQKISAFGEVPFKVAVEIALAFVRSGVGLPF